MATISKSKKSVRKSVRLVRAAKPVKVLPYGITARALPAGVAKAGDNAATAYEFGKNADWAAVAAAYESRSL